MSENRDKKLPFIDWLRCCSMISIILCHMVQIPGSKVQFLAQLFNLGVQVFFLVSGFSLGLQGEITDIKKWYKRRFRKVFVPYLFFLMVLFTVYCCKPYCFAQLTPGIFFSTLFGVQGFTKTLLGATQTWFITSILLFYLVLPFFSKMWFRLSYRKSNKIAILLILVVAFFLTYLILEKLVAVIIGPVFMALAAYIIGVEYKSDLYSKIKIIPTVLFMIISFLTRFACVFIRHEKLEAVFVAVSAFGIAFTVCALFLVIFRKSQGNKYLSFLTGISFEVYLYHNMFIEGPIYLMYKTNSIIFNIVITCAAIFASAFLANKIVAFLNTKIFNEKKGIDS